METLLIPQFVLVILLAVIAFFLRHSLADIRAQSLQIEALTHRILVLEERERGLNAQVSEIKDKIDSLATDMQFVREQIVALVGKYQS